MCCSGFTHQNSLDSMVCFFRLSLSAMEMVDHSFELWKDQIILMNSPKHKENICPHTATIRLGSFSVCKYFSVFLHQDTSNTISYQLMLVDTETTNTLVLHFKQLSTRIIICKYFRFL